MITIPKQCFDEIVAHTNEEYPDECCGIAIGVGDEVREVLRGTNLTKSPYVYKIDPKDILRAMNVVRERDGWDIIGFYHSHTATDKSKVTEAYPSKTDREESVGWPQALYLILSLKDRDKPQLRGFYFRDDEPQEQELRIG